MLISIYVCCLVRKRTVFVTWSDALPCYMLSFAEFDVIIDTHSCWSAVKYLCAIFPIRWDAKSTLFSRNMLLVVTFPAFVLVFVESCSCFFLGASRGWAEPHFDWRTDSRSIDVSVKQDCSKALCQIVTSIQFAQLTKTVQGCSTVAQTISVRFPKYSYYYFN